MNQPYTILGLALWILAAVMIAFATDIRKGRSWYIRLVRGLMPGIEPHPLVRHLRFVQMVGGIWILGGYLLSALANQISPDWLITVLAYLLWGVPPLLLLWYSRTAATRSKGQIHSNDR